VKDETIGPLWWTTRLFVWLVILGAGAAVCVAVIVPRLGGATPYTILTGSMTPECPPGTLVVMKPISARDVSAGDVITYQLDSGKGAVVTHRVAAVGSNLKGETRLTTQGDANEIPDSELVRPVQVQGKLWYSVPYLGYVNTAMTGNQRQIATYGVVSVLLLYAAYMFTSAVRDRRRERVAEGVSRS